MNLLSIFFSCIDLPIFKPLYLKILFAMAPTIIMLLNFGIKFFIILIFDDILDPPIMHVTGFFIFVVILLRAATSVLI